MQCACAVLYCHLLPVPLYHILPHYLLPVPLYHILPHYLINGMIFDQKQVTAHRMCVLVLATTWYETFLILTRLQLYTRQPMLPSWLDGFWPITTWPWCHILPTHSILHPATFSYFQNWKWSLTLWRLMSYIYGAPILDVSRSHTTTQHSR